jgi:hypothetical protein
VAGWAQIVSTINVLNGGAVGPLWFRRSNLGEPPQPLLTYTMTIISVIFIDFIAKVYIAGCDLDIPDGPIGLQRTLDL